MIDPHRRLAAHHFAYLRAWVEGVPLVDAARRYLGLEHGHQAVTIHRLVIDELRALARRRGDRRWRLIGIDVGARTEATGPASQPNLHEWAAAKGLEGWSEAELLELYQEAFPPQNPQGERKQLRNAKLRQRQLAVLADLEHAVGMPVAPTDPVDTWFEPAVAERLKRAGYLLLGELASAIRRGGRWWRGIPGVGAVKAGRIEALLTALLPDHLRTPVSAAIQSAGLPALPPNRHALDGSAGANRSPLPPRVPATTDLEAINAWLSATVGQPGEPGHNAVTDATYRREAQRWLLFCVLERGKAMSSADTEDCRAYMAFLNRVPEHWQSLRPAPRLDVEAGWTPFRKQPGLASRRLAVKVVHLMCHWLEKQRYLDSNPWSAVNRSLVDGDETPPAPTSRALTPSAYQALLAGLPDPTRPGSTRNGFIVVFTRFTGLRAAELLRATIADLVEHDYGWKLNVLGKGRKRRQVSVPSPAIAVLQQYLAARGLPPLGSCPGSTPLLAALDDPARAPTYSAVYQSIKAFIRRAMRSSDLPPAERARAEKATQHWLRHTFATRSAEAGVPEDVLMAEMGHASRATTAGYYQAQEQRRQELMERAAAVGME
ncbi:tyrosine-type recombinase/integrase [Eleftheria terrae]|uniref:tyrosine-type recombinase/integrase n=1 Tax=Eleftheria terrae TaxID=1597781 RepID=UPI00263AB55B|nr:tyrosine-type recombinase/integrase [Eleftheria terrae]WKB50550.1 site-specific integrase [Eleftheria terrae]